MRQMMNTFGSTLLLGVLLASCGSSSNNKEAANAETGQEPKAAAASDPAPVGTAAVSTACQADADCVKDKCCHAAACIAVSSAKDCSDAMCTEDCKPGTMDCGKGSCACVNGECAVKWVK
jgi:hypothetical protein